MFADNFLHFCECILTSKRNLFSEFRNGLSVKLTLCVHLGTHFSYLIFFSTNDLILCVDHILQSLNRLVSGILHFSMLLLRLALSFHSSIFNSVTQMLFLIQVLITILPLFVPSDLSIFLISFHPHILNFLLQFSYLSSLVIENYRLSVTCCSIICSIRHVTVCNVLVCKTTILA